MGAIAFFLAGYYKIQKVDILSLSTFCGALALLQEMNIYIVRA